MDRHQAAALLQQLGVDTDKLTAALAHPGAMPAIRLLSLLDTIEAAKPPAAAPPKPKRKSKAKKTEDGQ